MLQRPPRPTRTDTLCPDTPRFRSQHRPLLESLADVDDHEAGVVGDQARPFSRPRLDRGGALAAAAGGLACLAHQIRPPLRGCTRLMNRCRPQARLPPAPLCLLCSRAAAPGPSPAWAPRCCPAARPAAG